MLHILQYIALIYITIHIIKSTLNSMDKGACYYGWTSSMASSVTMCMIGYIILMCNKDVQNG